jgi:polysaccharide chain length determinant protein (PEP-CTERM system associated)
MDSNQTALLAVEQALGMWRFRRVALVVAWVVAVVGWLWVLQLPNSYTAHARVYLDTESTLKPLLEGLAVSTDTVSQVSMMTRALLSRPQLEAVMASTGLEARAQSPQEKDELVTRLKTHIAISKLPGENIYNIGFVDHDAQMAHDVVQALVTNFMQKSLIAGESDTAQAQEFLETQLRLYESRLIEAEDRLANFKKANVGLMPGEEGDYYERLQAAETSVRAIDAKIQVLRQRRSELNRQLQGEEPVFGLATPTLVAGPTATSVDRPIADFERQLQELLLKFTDKHPDVVNVRKTLEDLYKLREKERARNALQGLSVSGGNLAENPVYQDMRMSLNRTDVELVGLRSELLDKRDNVRYLKKMVDTIPEVEAQLNRLNRDYNVVKKQYDTLLERLESARLAEEVREDSEEITFDVLDPPRVPLAPSAPNRPILNIVVFFLALLAGGGLAFASNQLNPVFFSSETLHASLGLPIFGVISLTERSRSRRGVVPFLFIAGALLAALAAVMIAGQRGLEPFQRFLTL